MQKRLCFSSFKLRISAHDHPNGPARFRYSRNRLTVWRCVNRLSTRISQMKR